MRKTKIVCTLGPAVDSDESIRRLIEHGMDAARFNFSHGTHEGHLATLNRLKRARDKLGVPVAAIMDTKGPEIRVKTFENGPVTVTTGGEFTLTTADVAGDEKRVSVTYANLHKELEVGARVLIDDGLVELKVKKITGQDILCDVVNGGTLSNNKSINLPGTHIQLPSLTEKDRSDIAFAAENDFDFIAASFIRCAADVEDIRAELHKHGGEGIRIISKIENQEGVDNLDEIIEASDGIMVARGDLGVEIPAYQVPIFQKEMIHKCLTRGKPVITATQMLDSMIRNPRPTRAEISDVANAVFDGTSAVMLSGETASGKYPIEALTTMADTVVAAEHATNYWGRFQKMEFAHQDNIVDAISHACCTTAMDLGATAILAATNSGNTARVIARFKPGCDIVALTMSERVRRQLAITWGVRPVLYGSVDSTDRLLYLCAEVAKKEGYVAAGDTVVLTAGIPLGEGTGTNMIKAQVIE